MDESHKRKESNKAFINDGGEEVDEDEKQMMEEDDKLEEELQVTISELIGAIFKTHKNVCGQVSTEVFHITIVQ